jgi:2-iminobutanoate/2-iminopropanoate deaminase
MNKKAVHSLSAPEAVGPYSQAVSVTDPERIVFCSGQIPLDPSTGELVADVGEATRVCLRNLGAVLSADGLGLQHVVRTTVFLIDMADFEAVNEVYATFFPGPPPARAAIQVSALPKGARVEIDAIAVG